MKKLLLIISMLVIYACSDEPTSNDNTHDLPVLTGDSVHVALGIPKDDYPSDEIILKRHQYWVSYNLKDGYPNWVSYELNKDWYGNATMYEGDYITDESIHEAYRIKHSDYTNSGYIRAHMVSSEERTTSLEDNKSTYLMTNIAPQVAELNKGPWLNLEKECERLCKMEDKELFVICGPMQGTIDRIASGKVKVPFYYFKIVIVLERGQNIKDINKNTRIIAVMMPNSDDERSDKWSNYKTIINAIEDHTGYNFLDFLPDDIEEKLESKAY